MEKTTNRQAAECFASELASCLGSELTRSGGAALNFALQTAPDLSRRNRHPIHFGISVNRLEQGHCFVEMDKRDVMALGASLLQEQACEDAERCTAAAEQAVARAVQQVKTKLAERYGQLEMAVERVASLPPGGMLLLPLTAAGPGSEIEVLLYFGSRFHEAIAGRSSAPSSDTGLFVDPRTLDLVLDVELNVSLRFGQRQMPLREVLELEGGSVIELDRRVDEPVELLLDGKVIASGEAVIVDGNYGLRVTNVHESFTTRTN